MKKICKYFILSIGLLFLLICIKEIVINSDQNISKKIKNVGSSLSERFVNICGIVSNGSGLYKLENKYVFRGNPDNYIIFNDELWRIVSLHSDGTVKIVKNDLVNVEKGYDDALAFLNNQFFNSLKNKDLIVEHDYDISYYDIGKLTSRQDLNDAFCTNKRKYNVGMLSVIEVADATINIVFDEYLNIFFWVNRNSNYLYLSDKWLTMTPSIYINFDFLKESDDVSAMIRPAVYLNEDLKICCGSGTKNDPYILESKI